MYCSLSFFWATFVYYLQLMLLVFGSVPVVTVTHGISNHLSPEFAIRIYKKQDQSNKSVFSHWIFCLWSLAPVGFFFSVQPCWQLLFMIIIFPLALFLHQGIFPSKYVPRTLSTADVKAFRKSAFVLHWQYKVEKINKTDIYLPENFANYYFNIFLST